MKQDLVIQQNMLSASCIRTQGIIYNYQLSNVQLSTTFQRLAQAQFIANKAELGIQYQKLCIQVLSQVAERLKLQNLKETRKYQEILETGWGHSLVSSLHSRNGFLALVVETFARAVTKFSGVVRFWLFFFTFLNILCRGLQSANKNKY